MSTAEVFRGTVKSDEEPDPLVNPDLVLVALRAISPERKFIENIAIEQVTTEKQAFCYLIARAREIKNSKPDTDNAIAEAYELLWERSHDYIAPSDFYGQQTLLKPFIGVYQNAELLKNIEL